MWLIIVLKVCADQAIFLKQLKKELLIEITILDNE